MTPEESCSRKVTAQPYNWPNGGGLSKYTTAIIVVDMQRDFCEAGGYLTNQGLDHKPCRAIIDSLCKMLALCKESEFPICFTRESHRADLSTLSSRELFRSRNNSTRRGIGDQGQSLGRSLVRGQPGCEVIPEFKSFIESHDVNVIDKPGRLAFAHTELDLILRNRGIKNLVLCGVTTDVCVHSTMREANDRGYDCLLIADACAAGTQELHQFAIESIQSEGGIFGSVAEMQDFVAALSRPYDLRRGTG